MVWLGSTIGTADGSRGDLDFADPPLGSDWHEVPQGATRGPNCLVQENYVDCEFVGKDGVYYLVFGTEVTRKEVRRASTQEAAALPFGLHFGDSAARVRQQMESLHSIELNYFELPADRAYAAELGTGLFLKNKLGVTFGLYFLFDKSDGLTVIGVTVGETG